MKEKELIKINTCSICKYFIVNKDEPQKLSDGLCCRYPHPEGKKRKDWCGEWVYNAIDPESKLPQRNITFNQDEPYAKRINRIILRRHRIILRRQRWKKLWIKIFSRGERGN